MMLGVVVVPFMCLCRADRDGTAFLIAFLIAFLKQGICNFDRFVADAR